jgi:hypothetical protein
MKTKKIKIGAASKKICWECYYSKANDLPNDEEFRSTLLMIFENRWKEGVVHCPEKERRGLTVFHVQLIKDAIKRCPKIFEHAVAAAAGKKSKKS